jgi:hypothetical protein
VNLAVRPGMAFLSIRDRLAPRRLLPLWRLTNGGQRILTCVLDQRDRTSVTLVIAIDATEIAARSYHNRTEALAHAGFLFDRLTADGWNVVMGMPEAALH